jgi:hypothetical protein
MGIWFMEMACLMNLLKVKGFHLTGRNRTPIFYDIYDKS